MQGDLGILVGKKAIKDIETTGDVLIWQVRERHLSVKVVYCGYLRTSLFLGDPSWKIRGWQIHRMIHARMLKLTIQEWKPWIKNIRMQCTKYYNEGITRGGTKQGDNFRSRTLQKMHLRLDLKAAAERTHMTARSWESTSACGCRGEGRFADKFFLVIISSSLPTSFLFTIHGQWP